MSKEDIIRMAIDAGWDAHHAEFDTRIQTFAALVASAEREVCARACEERGMVKGGEVFAARIRARNDTSSKRVDITEEHKHDY